MFPTRLSGLLQGCNSPLLHRLIKSVNILFIECPPLLSLVIPQIISLHVRLITVWVAYSGLTLIFFRNETQLGLDGQAFHDGDLGNESLDMFAQYRDTLFIGVWIGDPPVRYGASCTSYNIHKMRELVDYIVSGCQTDPVTNARVQYVLEHDQGKQYCAASGLQSQVAGDPDAHMLR